MNKTILNNLVARLEKITKEVGQPLNHQDNLEQEVSDVDFLTSGLEKIANLLTDTFNDIDATLLHLRIGQEIHRERLQDSLTTVSTILMNYPEVFVKMDVPTIKMFLENVDFQTLKIALADISPEIISSWYATLAEVLEGDNDIQKERT